MDRGSLSPHVSPSSQNNDMDHEDQDTRSFAEGAAHLVARGITPTLILEIGATGVEERTLPGANPPFHSFALWPMRPGGRRGRKGRGPLRWRFFLGLHRGELAVEVATVPPLKVKR